MLNVNVGILGHVDSGKTSLSKALSTVSSTASFDKNPQSMERGMTLDLGFSSFTVDVSGHNQFAAKNIQTLQVTLVDCPGHASLIRTVIGGAQIVDCLVVVVDATKGIQTQTAECLVVGEVIGKPLIVALNKVDAVQASNEAERGETLKKMKRRLEKTFLTTRWPGVPIVEVAADPGARGLHQPKATTDDAAAPIVVPPLGLQALKDRIVASIDIMLVDTRNAATKQRDGFLMFVDHCFPVKGQGTVLTGTVMQGHIAVGDDLLLPDYQVTRRIKSIQMFRKSVPSTKQGDRVGVCIAQFDAKDMERGVACGSNAGVVSVSTVVAAVQKVRYHNRPIEAGQKFHISIGHTTVMGTMRFFSSMPLAGSAGRSNASFDLAGEYLHLDGLPDDSAPGYDASSVRSDGQPAALQATKTVYYAVVLLERPVTTVLGATLIASHLDSDIHATTCRLAVMGHIVCVTGLDDPEAWRSLRAIKYKQKRISIDRIVDTKTCIAKGFVRPKEGVDAKIAGAQMFADVQRFIGMSVHGTWPRPQLVTAAAEGAEGTLLDASAIAVPDARTKAPPTDAAVGKIDSAFGKTGKVRIVFGTDVFVVPQQKPSSHRGRGRGRGKSSAAPSDKQPEETAAESDAEDDKDTVDDASKRSAVVSTNATPHSGAANVRLYFYSKKYPFAQYCPLQQ